MQLPLVPAPRFTAMSFLAAIMRLTSSSPTEPGRVAVTWGGSHTDAILGLDELLCLWRAVLEDPCGQGECWEVHSGVLRCNVRLVLEKRINKKFDLNFFERRQCICTRRSTRRLWHAACTPCPAAARCGTVPTAGRRGVRGGIEQTKGRPFLACRRTCQN